ncbi:MAG: c-type cytochrome domain-containing protein [Longimicrobiales bacterium]
MNRGSTRRHRKHTRYGWTTAALGAALVAFAGTPVPAPITIELQAVSFATDVMPIFQNSCVECHGAEGDDGEVRLEASLNLLTYEGLMAGSEFGSVIEPGDAEGSYLLEMVVEGDMPEEGDPLPEAEIETIRTRIQEGATNN